MSAPLEPDPWDEFQRLIDSPPALESESLRQEFSPETLLWAALSPGWTAPLAQLCGFPDWDNDNIETRFEAMLAEGILESYPVNGPTPTGPTPTSKQSTGSDKVHIFETLRKSKKIPYYQMVAARRAKVLQTYLGQAGGPRTPGSPSETAAPKQAVLPLRSKISKGIFTPNQRDNPQPDTSPFELVKLCAEIGRRMQKAQASDASVLPSALAQWSSLAALADEPSAVAERFSTEVEAHFEAGQSGPILNWIETARPLAALMDYTFQTELSVAIGQAGRRIELLNRRANDYRHLASFLRREEQIQAAAELLNGPDEQWALHLIGSGGVGKTMIIRYITCLLAGGTESPCQEDRSPVDQPVAVARIDFDYLNPDYPRLRPGLLLWSLAQELRAYDQSGGEANRKFDQANQKLNQLHDLIARGRLIPGENIDQSPFYKGAIQYYIEALNGLRMKVLLILDTCEELAKASPEDEPNRNVDDTFRILETLHAGCPNLRVIFSGRRLLASAGAGWSADGTDLLPRSFLRLHRIRGFPLEEAGRYLLRENVPAGLVDAVLRASSPDMPGSLVIHWHNQDADPDLLRCNPYQLRMYMDWAREDPPPPPEALEAAVSGHYVEARILQRLKNPALEELLPAAALLGHFDRPALRSASSQDEADFADAFTALTQQEWVSTRRAAAVDGQDDRTVYDLEPNIRNQLCAYFANRPLPTAELAAATAFLQKRTLEEPLEALDWTDFDAALRAADAGPGLETQWWEAVYQRLFEARVQGSAAETVRGLLETLCGRDGSAGPRDPSAGPEIPPENRLRPFLLASLASVQLWMGDLARARATWQTVEGLASPHAPDSRPHLRLLRLALAGQIPRERESSAALEPGLLERFWKSWANQPILLELFNDPELLAALAGALESLVQDAERSAQISPPFQKFLSRQLLSTWFTPEGLGPANLRCWLASLTGRAWLVAGQNWEASQRLPKSLQPLPQDAEPRQSFLYWQAPANLAERLKLEFAHAAYPRLLSAADTLAALGSLPDLWQTPANQPENVDQERLLSAGLSLRLAQAPLPLEELARWRGLSFQSLPPRCETHRRISPLFLTIAEALLAAGQTEETRKRLWEVKKLDDATDLQVDRARLRLSLRLRLSELGDRAGTLLADYSHDPEDLALLVQARLLEGPNTQTPAPLALPRGDPLDPHLSWRSAYALPETDPTRPGSGRGDGELQSLAIRLRAARGEAANPLDRMTLTLDLLEIFQIEPEFKIPAAGTASPSQEPGAVPDDSFPEAPQALPTSELDFWNEIFITKWAKDAREDALAGLRQALRLQALSQSSTVLQNFVKERIASTVQEQIQALSAWLGLRRSAQIALEEAGWLGLNLPALAFPLCDQALRFHLAAGDLPAAFFAALQGQLLRAQAFPTAAGSQTFAQYLSAAVKEEEPGSLYAEILASPPSSPPSSPLAELGLPSAENLAAAANAPLRENLATLRPFTWLPWLLRWTALRAIAASTAPADLPAFTREAIPQTSRSRGFLAAELEMLFKNGVNASPPTNPSLEKPPKKRTFLDYFTYFIYVLLGGILLAVVYLQYRFIADRIPPNPTGLMLYCVWPGVAAALTIAEIVGLGLLLGNAGSLMARIRETIWRLFGYRNHFIDLDIQDGLQAPQDFHRQVRLKVTRWVPRWSWLRAPFYSLQNQPEAEVTASVPLSLDAFAGLPDALAERMQAPAALPNSRLDTILRLNIQDGLQNLPWEYALANLGRSGADLPKEQPGLFARGPYRFWEDSAKPFAQPVTVLGYAAFQSDLQILLNAWKPLQRTLPTSPSLGRRLLPGLFPDPPALTYRSTSELAPQPRSIGILHLIAPVDRGEPGLVLRLRGNGQRVAQIDQSASAQEGQPAETTSEDLFNLFAQGLGLCLLQGEPIATPTQRTDSDRITAGDTRSFATELGFHGIPVVLIPPLPGPLAARVAAQIAAAALYYYQPGGQLKLLRALRQARELIQRESGDPLSSSELAYDLCIFAPNLAFPHPEESVQAAV